MEEEADWLGPQDVRSDMPVSSWLFFLPPLNPRDQVLEELTTGDANGCNRKDTTAPPPKKSCSL